MAKLANKKTTILIILDGWGLSKHKNKQSLKLVRSVEMKLKSHFSLAANYKRLTIRPDTAPHYFSWFKKFPHTELAASGEAVGLFRGQEGNSEAGHLNLGAGRVVRQDALYISDAIADGTFFKNNAFHQALYHVKKYRTAAHVMGLLSNHNSAHSCPEHLTALFELFHRQGIKKVYLHLFTDGRDSGQYDAPNHLKKLLPHLRGGEQVATVMGRLYAMDRNKDWARIKKAYEAIVLGRGKRTARSAEEALAQGYNRRETDEFIEPTVIVDERGRPIATVKDNDAIFFFNLRSDRARELTKAFVQPDFDKVNYGAFSRARVPKNIRFVAMTDFGPDLPGVLTAFSSRDVKNSLVQALCPRRQLYIAESEKFAHITYFFNGGYAQHFCDERWVKIESDRLAHYSEEPEMKDSQLADYIVRAIKDQRFEFIAANFANPDMVGHTGNFAAGEKAVRAVDAAVGRIVQAILKYGGQGIITADHGNIEEMVNIKTGEVDTEHSTNPVPLFVVANPDAYQLWKIRSGTKLSKGKLANVAPTILKMIGISKPAEMTAKPLF